MRKIIILFALCFFVLSGCASDKEYSEMNPPPQGTQPLEEKVILSDKVKILIPEGFEIMSEEMANYKYPSGDRPTLIYTNEEGSINVAFNHTVHKISQDEFDDYTKDMKKVFKTMHPDAEFYDDDIVTINKKTVSYLELLTPAIDTDVYNLIFFTELDGRLLMGTFNCTKEEMDDWRNTGKEILYSLQILS